MKKTEMICGIHSCRHVLTHAHKQVIMVWILEDPHSKALLRLKKKIQLLALPLKEVGRIELDRLSWHARHQGVIIKRYAVRDRDASLTQLLTTADNPPKLFLVLDRIQDPHNLGACLRSAEAAGVKAVIIPKDNAAGLTANVAKASCGALETVRLIPVVNLVRTLEQMKRAGIWLVGTDAASPHTLYEQDLTMPLALVIGNEEKGMRLSVRRCCDYLVSIPMLGKLESLNASVATGIALYEIQRQRGLHQATRPASRVLP